MVLTYPNGSVIMQIQHNQMVVLEYRKGGPMNTSLINTRRNKGLTQVQVAEKASISEVAYQRYESGERTPNVYIGQRIAKALNTKVERIFPLSDDAPNSQENNNTKPEKRQDTRYSVDGHRRTPGDDSGGKSY